MKVAVTGIKPTGSPHLGNYFGMILPALDLAQQLAWILHFQLFRHVAAEDAVPAMRERYAAGGLGTGRPKTSLPARSSKPSVQPVSATPGNRGRTG